MLWAFFWHTVLEKQVCGFIQTLRNALGEGGGQPICYKMLHLLFFKVNSQIVNSGQFWQKIVNFLKKQSTMCKSGPSSGAKCNSGEHCIPYDQQVWVVWCVYIMQVTNYVCYNPSNNVPSPKCGIHQQLFVQSKGASQPGNPLIRKSPQKHIYRRTKVNVSKSPYK